MAAEESPFGEGAEPPERRLLPLSAKTPEALRELAQRYLSWLDGHAEELSAAGAATDPLLSDLAWTASMGRSHFSHRAGLVFSDAESLRQQLSALHETGGQRVQSGAAAPESGDDPLAVIAAEYADGQAIQFESLFQGEARRRISLPDYPFQRQRFWVEAPPQSKGVEDD